MDRKFAGLALLVTVGAGPFATAAHADATFFAAKKSLTSSTPFGSDRRLDQLGFQGSTDVFGGSNFLNFADGSLTNNLGTFGWNVPITRDVSTSGNSVGANPDRADGSSPYLGEGSASGTLAEVFGSFGGYKNMSRLIDSEDNAAWFMDLYFGPGQSLSADANGSSVELAVLERGGNSDFNVYGIFADHSLTGPLYVDRDWLGETGWSLDSLEIGGAQKVHGIGVSLDPSWSNLAGIRIEALSNFNGPDIVAVGAAMVIPGPAAIAALGVGFGVFGLGGRRRRA